MILSYKFAGLCYYMSEVKKKPKLYKVLRDICVNSSSTHDLITKMIDFINKYFEPREKKDWYPF